MKNKIVRGLLIIVITLIVIDQVSKILVSNFLKEPVGNEFVGLEIVTNTGMALGFNEGNIKNILLTIFVLLIIIRFVKNQIERIDTKTMVAISLVLAGGIGNLIDRFFRGGVLDFIKLYKLPIFNLSDVFVVLGWILLVIFIIDFTRKN
ncbi:MAG TPA: signal peptidase II [Candidatus Scatovivens faecipullorum]|nr:signal peptidase II [Candidatus Scatovivens faecipullorum]